MKVSESHNRKWFRKSILKTEWIYGRTQFFNGRTQFFMHSFMKTYNCTTINSSTVGFPALMELFFSDWQQQWRIWNRVFSSGLSKFCGRQPLKNVLSALMNTLSHIFTSRSSSAFAQKVSFCEDQLHITWNAGI